ncbi:magnesium transporter CorA family protein [Methanogenium organophilum]|uniref:Magnesium transporter CorA family protein n=1 Tax=Methanogenium organophilum TaxID=2199 RepID=A0A9X9S2S9_METOG|nr:magnesium transporter CorA family protein [Methanogenium organophilum]WAI00450.1 magnesium transporter CorA family protein [Methanogenium organophilum]
MIEIFLSRSNDAGDSGPPPEISSFANNCWVNLTAPDDALLRRVAAGLAVPEEFLRAALDEEEQPRIESEDGVSLVIIDIPEVTSGEKPYLYSTFPLGIIITEGAIITVALRRNRIIDPFLSGEVKSFSTHKRTRFLFLILFATARLYLRDLRLIDKKSEEYEQMLHRSMKNEALLALMNLEKSLVFFSTSLKANEAVLEKIMKFGPIRFYEEDRELLDDVIIENRQAIEMAGIYSNILSGMMNAFASVINNNMNRVMKILASITIIFSVPTIISSFYGMNVRLPMQNNPSAYLIIILLSAAVCFALGYILKSKEFL